MATDPSGRARVSRHSIGGILRGNRNPHGTDCSPCRYSPDPKENPMISFCPRRRSKTGWLVVVLLAIVASGCSPKESQTTTTPPGGPSSGAAPGGGPYAGPAASTPPSAPGKAAKAPAGGSPE